MKRKHKYNRCKFKYRVISDVPMAPTGHNAMHNSLRAEEGMRHEQETTPLLVFPPSERSPWSVRCVVALGILVVVLVTGVLISSYLIYVEEKEEPPMPMVISMTLVNREVWVNVVDAPVKFDPIPHPLRHLIVVQTGGPTCKDIPICIELLKNMQEKNGGSLMYNFLLSSNGATFEAFGWDGMSPMFPQLPALVFAFIGDYSKDYPSVLQMEEAFTLIDLTIAKGVLSRDFTIVGKIVNSTQVPTYLFDSLQNLTQWDRVLSDDY